MVVGLIWLARRAPKPAILFYSFLLTHLLFTLNTVQDVMAYLLLPFAALAIAAGFGASAILSNLQSFGKAQDKSSIPNLQSPDLQSPPRLALIAVARPPGCSNLARGISLRDFDTAEEYVAAVYDRFAGRGEGAVLLSDWEHLTPLWVHTYTAGGAAGRG